MELQRMIDLVMCLGIETWNKLVYIIILGYKLVS